MGQSTFKLMMFSDSIFEENYSKTNLQLTGDDALKNCGTICSVKEDDCQLFKFEVDKGIQRIAFQDLFLIIKYIFF